MSQRNSFLTMIAVLTTLFCGVTRGAAPPSGNDSAKLATYDNSAGQTYFALSLTPPQTAASDSAHDILVLFDTSASQTGAYRDDALAGLKTMLAGWAVKIASN